MIIRGVDIKFFSEEHKRFFLEMIARTKADDYHLPFFYIVGSDEQLRRCVDQLFDFDTDRIIFDGLNKPWQSSGTTILCRMAFNLWNGFCGDAVSENPELYTAYWLFGYYNAPGVFMEALKLSASDIFLSSRFPKIE